MVLILLFFVAAFAVTSAGVLLYWYWHTRRALLGQADHTGLRWDWMETAPLLRPNSLSTISIWDRLLKKVDYVETVRTRIGEAGMRWSVGRLTALMLLLGAVAAAALARQSWTSGWVCLAGAAFAAWTPYQYVLWRRRRRLERFEALFPDALDSLARALRAAHPLAAGLEILAGESAEPLAGEMRLTLRERNFGLPWDQALENLARRVPLAEVSIFVAAVQLQNRIGGKLGEVLARLSETMRESVSLKSEVRSIAAHSRLTGKVLMVLPLAIATVMAAVNPRHLVILWTYPVGKHLVAAAAAALVLAWLIIRKLTEVRI